MANIGFGAYDGFRSLGFQTTPQTFQGDDKKVPFKYRIPLALALGLSVAYLEGEGPIMERLKPSSYGGYADLESFTVTAAAVTSAALAASWLWDKLN